MIEKSLQRMQRILQKITEKGSGGGKHIVVFCHVHTFVYKANQPRTTTKNSSREKYRVMYGKSKTRLDAF